VPLLDVQDLRLMLPSAQGPVAALRGLNFTLERGQTLGLIGESGCGKSLTALALMGLLPEGARLQGALHFDGQDLAQLDEPAWCRLRGRRIAMVFQEPMTALNPLHTIGRQVAEPLRLHLGLSAAEARARALALLERVQLPQAAQRLDAYPHQLSGGQRQRVVIAIALACGPALLVADEPTTALDATLQHEVLQLLLRLVQEDGMALLLISHDLALMARSVQRLAVMYAGRFVEQGDTAQVLANPAHPYTQGLLAARPRLGAGHSRRGRAGDVAPLATIPGRVPGLHEMPPGCAFAARCAQAGDACRSAVPQLREVHAAAPGWQAACVRVGGA
jgi:peptide/nickel transport system ATP-binding protein